MIRGLNRAPLSRALRRLLVARAQIRHDHSAAAVDINKIPLTDPVPGFERLFYVDPKSLERFEAKLTVLENGLRIATEPTFGEYATLGVAIDSGSRYEAHYPSGTCHFIEKLAFSSSTNYQSREEIFSILENKGALIDCQATRDTFIYASSCHENGIDEIVKIIADGVLRPQVTEEEMEVSRQIIKFDNENMLRTPECEPLLMDWVHQAAFQGNTLGFSKFCMPDNTRKITRKHILSFLSQYYTPERIVLAGVGVDHDYLVEAGKKYFSFAESSWAKHPAFVLNPLPPVDHSIAQYTGGDVRVNRDLSRMALGPTPFPNLSHVVIGFEGAPINHDDFVPFCVLQALMGGGGSFSAGGPGKGMYTRLYTEVMNRHHWIYNATAFNHSYMDAGLFCIRGSGAPEQTDVMVKVILDQYFKLTEGVKKDELERAKTQLKSQLMMNLEIRPVMFEDLARQILINGHRKKPQEYLEKIDKVKNEDIVRIAEKMLVSKPAVVGYGDLRKLPRYEAIDQAVANRSYSKL